MSSDERWYFTKEQLENSPSRRCGIDADKELSQRQQAANFIQDMGQRLQVTQLCINTAIVYMHRFYCFHSFTLFHRNAIASAALFLAAKVEEQPRKLEHIIKVAQTCLQKGQANIDRRSEMYAEQAQELIGNENILLMTLGFDVAIEHPHAFIVKFCHIANASKDLSQTSYFMASNSLHLTTMCLQYKPTVVAAFCIHLVCKWSNWQIPKSKENLPWYSYIDPTVTEELLEQLTNEFLVIFDRCPSRLKKKIQNTQLSTQNSSMSSYPFDMDPRRQTNGAQQKGDGVGVPAAGPSKNLFPPEMKKLTNAATASGHHQSPVKPPPPSVASTNGTIGAPPDSSAASKLPNAATARPGIGHGAQPTNAFGSSSHHHHHHHHHHHKTGVSHSSSSTKPKIAPPPPSNHTGPPPSAKEATRAAIAPATKPEPMAVAAPSTLANHSHASKKLENGPDTNGRTGNGACGFASSASHSDIISNVVKEVAMAKQNEKQRLAAKQEPGEDVKPYLPELEAAVASVSKASKSHSIFSPSPIGRGDSGRSSPVHDKVGPLLEPKKELDPMLVTKKPEAATGYEDILRKNAAANPMTTGTTTVPVLGANNIAIKEEPVDACDYVKGQVVAGQLPHHMAEEQHHHVDKAEANDCLSSHSHKKKKKHKEKDKRHDKEKRHHKEKKRHKEEKHRHRKERSPEKEMPKEPGPIKITIPKEKLTDIPMKLKIKINKEQALAAATAADVVATPDLKLKISKDKGKSRKRTRESDTEDSGKRIAYDNASSSHNGYKEYRSG